MPCCAFSGDNVIFTPHTGVRVEANTVLNIKFPGQAAEMYSIEVDKHKSMTSDDEKIIYVGFTGNCDIQKLILLIHESAKAVIAALTQTAPAPVKLSVAAVHCS